MIRVRISVPAPGVNMKTIYGVNMKTIYGVIVDNGDGSQSIEWYRNTSLETLENLQDEKYMSGDGVQITTLSFPDYVNIDDIEGIFWEDFDIEE